MNACIAECRYYGFGCKSECLSEPAYVTFRGVFKSQMMYVQYVYVYQMGRHTCGINIYGK